MPAPTEPTGDQSGATDLGDDERGSEVSDYTGEVPRVGTTDGSADSAGPAPSGFGDGDVADVDADSDSSDSHTPEESADADAGGIPDLSPQEIAVLLEERDQYRDAAVRLQADFENFRKRSATQNAADIDRATGRLAEALLPVLDAAETAYVSHPDEVGPLLNALLGELRKQGLETFDLEGTVFDPVTAEAVTHEPGDGDEVVVADVLRSGYSWKGKTLRAAMVKTTDGTGTDPASSDEADSTQDTGGN